MLLREDGSESRQIRLLIVGRIIHQTDAFKPDVQALLLGEVLILVDNPADAKFSSLKTLDATTASHAVWRTLCLKSLLLPHASDHRIAAYRK